MTHQITEEPFRFAILGAVLIFAGAGCRNNDMPGVAATISIAAGNNQQAAVGTSLATAPTVLVQDGAHNTVSGATVRFTVITGGGTVLGDTAVTDANGRAMAGEWILGTSPGANTLRATVSGTTLAVTITATAVAGSGVSLRTSGQQGFLALVGQPVTPPPSVLVLDSFNNPAPGVSVTFAVAQGGGSATGTAATTNSSGIAQVGSWTLGPVAGSNLLTARIAGGPTVSFTAQALTSAPVLTATSPVTQAGFLSFMVTNVPRVRVTDDLGHPLSGVPVHFAVTGGDGTITGGAATSDASGVASPADWRIGNSGSSTVTATSGLGALPVTFTATGVPASFLIDVRFLTTVTADVRDAFVTAATRWMRIITAHLTPVTVNLPAGACSALQPAMSESVTDLVIFAEVSPIDGVGNVLASSGPCAERSSSSLPAVGTMQFDVADLLNSQNNGQLIPTITHEMAHVLGFGTIWSNLHLITGAGMADPTFTGANALAQWPVFAAAIGYAGQPVPVEMCGGAGTRDAHWRENINCGSGTPIFGAELMTGYIEAPGVPMPLSKMTIASMQDLGYRVDYGQADLFREHLVAGTVTAAPGKPLNEQLHSAAWQVTTGGVTRRIP
jgi:hypothetical protein